MLKIIRCSEYRTKISLIEPRLYLDVFKNAYLKTKTGKHIALEPNAKSRAQTDSKWVRWINRYSLILILFHKKLGKVREGNPQNDPTWCWGGGAWGKVR